MGWHDGVGLDLHHAPRRLAACGALLVLLAGCGGGGSASTPPTDTLPPVVALTDPADGLVGVLTTASVRVTFAEAMDEGAVLGALVVTGPSGPVAGSWTWSPTTFTASFTPSAPFAPATTYHVTVGVGARDLAGNALAAPATSSFTTLAIPEVIDTYPLDGWTGVSTLAEIRVSFGVVMDPASLQAAFSLRLAEGGGAVPGTFRFTDSEMYNLYFKPTAPLAAGSAYDVVVTTAAQGADGVPIASDFRLTFTTGAPLQRQLTVAPSPASSWAAIYGRITDDLGKIDCGGTATACTASYDVGTVVTLRATAAPAAEFLGWGGDDCTGAGTAATTTVTLDVGRGCSATFQPLAGLTATMSVTMGPWIGRVYEQRDYGFDPRLDCGADAVLVPPACSLALASNAWIMLRASPTAGAPAGTIRWTCTSDDLAVPPTQPTVTYSGTLTPNLYMTRNKECHAELAVAPP